MADEYRLADAIDASTGIGWEATDHELVAWYRATSSGVFKTILSYIPGVDDTLRELSREEVAGVGHVKTGDVRRARAIRIAPAVVVAINADPELDFADTPESLVIAVRRAVPTVNTASITVARQLAGWRSEALPESLPPLNTVTAERRVNPHG